MEWTWMDVLIHVLALPAYLLVGTARHELSHALAAALRGYRVTRISIVPVPFKQWGFCEWEPKEPFYQKETPVMYLAPYWCDAICVAAWLLVEWLVEFENFHWWAVLTVLLLVSPMVNFLSNFVWCWLIRGSGDFAQAFPKEKN